MESFLARVIKVYPTNEKPYDRVIGSIKVYNDNADFTKEDSGRLYGAITYAYQNAIVEEDYAFPFDKNNFTFPIQGETVTIIKIENETFYLPYSNPPYPNYREKASTSISSEGTSNKSVGDNKSAADARTKVATGASYTPNTNTKEKENRGGYIVNEKIKFLQPRNGDTIISGRAGNTIRFSEFFLTEDEKISVNGNPIGGTSSPSIFIRNKQNPTEDSEPIGTLIEESIDKDGTSVYITSGKVKIPFRETIKKQKVAFTGYPNSKDLKGNQFFVNSDRIVLSAKAYEFIIFGKGNTGVITDGRFTIDADKEIYAHSNKDVIFHTNKNIVLNSDASGVVYVGKVGKVGAAGADVQRMVLAGELIEIMNELIDEVCNMVFATPVGPTSAGPHNVMVFKMIKAKLSKIQSSRNFLSK
jgi:hypothetical protein